MPDSPDDPRDWNDAELARRASLREDAAWKELLTRAGPSARWIMERTFRKAGLSDPKGEAEDAVGNWTAALLEHDARALLAYQPHTPLRIYLGAIARSVACRILRARRPDRPLETDPFASLPDEPAFSPEEVRKALTSLPPRDQLLLRMSYWEEVRPERIAAVLGVRPSSMGTLLARARAALRTALERKSAEPRQGSFPERQP